MVSEKKAVMNTEYFSGSTASIFIGDTWIDDICDWQYQIDYSATPIYGYGSQLYDHVAEGRLLVQGSFTINFREPNYLWAILERYHKKTRTTFLKDDSLFKNEDYLESDASMAAQKRAKLDLFFKSGDPREVVNTIKKNRVNNVSKEVSEEIDFKYKTFDILLGYGSTLNENSPGEKIVGTKIRGKSKVIYADGTPIKEQYSFFARNII